MFKSFQVQKRSNNSFPTFGHAQGFRATSLWFNSATELDRNIVAAGGTDDRRQVQYIDARELLEARTYPFGLSLPALYFYQPLINFGRYDTDHASVAAPPFRCYSLQDFSNCSSRTPNTRGFTAL